MVYVANSQPKRLGVIAFPGDLDGLNVGPAINVEAQLKDGTDPRVLNRLPVNPAGEPRFIRVVEDIPVQGERIPLAVMLGYDRFWIFNVSDPQHPVQYPSKSLAELGVTGFARWLEIEGTLAYTVIDNDVAVIDFADPANPRLVSRLTGLGSHLSGLAVKDGFIYSLSAGNGPTDGLSVAVANPASRLFVFGSSPDSTTVCANPIILDRTNLTMKQNAGFYFQIFGHHRPIAQEIVIRKGEQIIATVPATILPESTDLVTIGKAEWQSSEQIDRTANYTAEVTLDKNEPGEFHSHREVIPFSFLLENYNNAITLSIKGAAADDKDEYPYSYLLGANANVTLTVGGNRVVFTGARSFGLHIELAKFTGMIEGRYPFTLSAQAAGDATISEQVTGLLTIQHSADNARAPGHSVVSGVDISTGNLGLSQEDVPSINNRGLSLSLMRSYNSTQANQFGPVGAGWTHNFQILLTSQRNANNVTYQMRGGDGSGQTFKAASLAGPLTVNAEKPYHGTLQRNSDGSFDYYTKARIRYHFPGAYEVNSFNFYDQSYMGNLEFMEEPNGNRLSLTFDSLGRMASVTDSSLRALSFTYEPGPSPFAGVMAVANGIQTEATCVPRGQFNMLRQRYAQGQSGQTWRIKKVNGPGGLELAYDYDQDGNLTKVTRKGVDEISASTADAVWQYAYKPTPGVQTPTDLTHFIKSVTNPNGHVTNYDYSFGQVGTPVKTVASPEGVSINYAYTLDATNRITQTTVTDGRGFATTHTFTADGYTSAINAPRGARTTFEFNDAGLKTKETDPLGAITTFEYDAKGNLRKQTMTGTDLASVSTETVYDQTFSKPLSERDGTGNTTSYTLDGHGNVTSVRNANGSVKRVDYARNGDALRITDERGLLTQLQYDNYGNVTSTDRETVAGQSNVTVSTFDARSRQLTATDTFEPSVTRTFDALDHIKTETVVDPAGFRDTSTSSYQYNAVGQLTNVTLSGNGQSVAQAYTYDNLERLITVEVTGSGVVDMVSRRLTYDGNSNVITKTDRRGVTTTYVYDALNFETSRRLSGPFGADIVEKTIVPDLIGNPQTLTDQYEQTTSFDYDSLHRVTKQTFPGPYFEQQTVDANGNITSTRDRNGRVNTVVYDSLNRPIRRTDPAGRVQTWTYSDATGTTITNWSPQNITVAEQTDVLGRQVRSVTTFGGNEYTTTVSYSGRSRTTVNPRGVSSTDQLSAFGTIGVHEVHAGNQTLRTELHYAALGGLKSTTDPNNNSTTFSFDGLNRKTSANYPGGLTESWSYDGEGLLLSHTNRRGVKTSISHDNQGRQLSAAAQGLNETIPIFSIAYDDAALKETHTDGNNNVSVYEYDGLHRLTALTNADHKSRSLSYDGVNLISESDFKGRLTEYVYDPADRVKQIKDRSNQITVIAHNDSNGYTRTVTDRRGNERIESYDQLDRLTRVTEGGETLVSYEYDGANNRTASSDGRANRTSYVYDELNRLKTCNHANLQTESYTYDGVGNVTAFNDGRGPDVTMEYDGLNRLHRRTNGAHQTTEFNYDGDGLLLEKIEPKGASYKTSYEYNALGSLKRITDARQGVWEFTYDNKQNLKTFSDARHNVTSYDYDMLDRVTTLHQPLSHDTTFTYDANGNRSFTRDPKGQAFTSVYDNVDRLVSKEFQNTGTIQDRYEYSYDPESDLTSVDHTRVNGGQPNTQHWSQTFDARRRLLSATDSFGKTVSYEYDAANNVTHLIDAAGRPTTYSYDAQNRLQSAALSGSRNVNYSWYADGLIQRVTYGTGLQREYTYDDADRVDHITNTVSSNGSGTQREEFAYTYDANSNRESETKTLNNQTERSAQYAYDQLNRLTQATYATPGGIINGNTLTYTYDAAGNRETENGTNASGSPVGRTFQNDELNRLTRLTEGSSVQQYDYDNNGNLIAKQVDGQPVNNYDYDPWNQLRLVTNGAQQEVARYDYDFARRRINRKLGGGSAEQRFAYDGVNVVDEFNEQNQLLNRYDYGQGLVRGEFAGEGERFYFSDALGSTTSLSQITQSGQATVANVTARYDYDAWGGIVNAVGGSGNQLGFSGQRLDAETGLMPLGNGERYYSTSLGRFTQEDSYAGEATMAQGLNRYAYVFNNPLAATDPSGHYIWEGTLNSTQADYTPLKYDLTWNDLPDRFNPYKGTGPLAVKAQNGGTGWKLAYVAFGLGTIGGGQKIDNLYGQWRKGEITTWQFTGGVAKQIAIGQARVSIFVGGIVASVALSELGLSPVVLVGTHALLGVIELGANDVINMAEGSQTEFSSRNTYIFTALTAGVLGLMPAPARRAAANVVTEGELFTTANAARLTTRMGAGEAEQLAESGGSRLAGRVGGATETELSFGASQVEGQGVRDFEVVSSSGSTWSLQTRKGLKEFTDESEYIGAVVHRQRSMAKGGAGMQAHAAEEIRLRDFEPSQLKLTIEGKNFQPDAITDISGARHIMELKTSGSYSKSLRNNIYLAARYAEEEQLPFTLILEGNARISKPLRNYIEGVQQRFGGIIK